MTLLTNAYSRCLSPALLTGQYGGHQPNAPSLKPKNLKIQFFGCPGHILSAFTAGSRAFPPSLEVLLDSPTSPKGKGSWRHSIILWCHWNPGPPIIEDTTYDQGFWPECKIMDARLGWTPSQNINMTICTFTLRSRSSLRSRHFSPACLVLSFYYALLSEQFNMRSLVARFEDKRFDIISLLLNDFFAYCYKNISISFLGTNGILQVTVKSLGLQQRLARQMNW